MHLSVLCNMVPDNCIDIVCGSDLAVAFTQLFYLFAEGLQAMVKHLVSKLSELRIALSLAPCICYLWGTE